MPQGRHRAEPVERSLPRLPRLPGLPRLRHPVAAAGIGAALLSVPLGVTLWPDAGSVRVTPAAAAADEGLRDLAAAAVGGRQDAAADSLRTATALRAEMRVSRDRTRTARRAPAVRQTAAAKVPNAVPVVVGKRWVTTTVNLRSGASASADRIGSLEAGTRVDVTGVAERGFSQVVVDRRAGWVRSTYLSTTKPKPQAERAAPGVSKAACSISRSIEPHLSSNARSVYRAVCAAFGGSVKSFGGYRAGDGGDHGSGRAVDIMVSGQPGRDIARYVQTHARELGVTYVIYEQKIWLAGNPLSQWKFMADRGSRTANHYDHVHVSVK